MENPTPGTEGGLVSIITIVRIAMLKHKARRIHAKMLRLPDNLDCGVNLFPDFEHERLRLKFRAVLDKLAKIDPEFPKARR